MLLPKLSDSVKQFVYHVKCGAYFIAV